MAAVSSRAIFQLANASGEGIRIGSGNATAALSGSETEVVDVAKLGKILTKNKEKRYSNCSGDSVFSIAKASQADAHEESENAEQGG